MDFRLDNAKHRQAMERNILLTFEYRLKDNFFSFF